jgi:hypothetical protein
VITIASAQVPRCLGPRQAKDVFLRKQGSLGWNEPLSAGGLRRPSGIGATAGWNEISTVLNAERNWLAAVPWDTVVAIDRELCEKGEGTPYGVNPAGYNAARQLWDEASARSVSLREALDICSRVHKLAPFTFFNGNTMGVIIPLLLEDVTKALPTVHAQIVRTTACHYLVGMVKLKELEDVFEHFDEFWRIP